MRVIGLTGPMGCGKSTVAAHLETKGYTRIKMAGVLKEMMRAMGLGYEHIEGSLKEVPSPLLCGKTPRFAMQTIGTEWGRNTIGENLWCNIWVAQALQALRTHSFGVLCDDIRFPNEADALKSVGGVLIEVVRPGHEKSASHESETFDVVPEIKLLNDRSIEHLIFSVDALLGVMPSAQPSLFSQDDDGVSGHPV